MSNPQRVAFVTGAGSGIGRATALAFAQAGAAVAVVDIGENSGQQTVRLIECAGGQALFLRADVSAEADVARAVESTVEQFGRLDWAFNNAGVGGPAGAAAAGGPAGFDMAVDDYQRVFDVNVRGVWLCLKYQLDHMRRAGGGSIVNTASIAGIVASRSGVYSASKHAVIGLTKSAALIYGAAGIRVNAVCPGMVDGTEMSRELIDELVEQYGDAERVKRERDVASPLGRVGQPEDIARAVLWLCSDDAAYITGLAVPVEGGLTMVHPHTMPGYQPMPVATPGEAA